VWTGLILLRIFFIGKLLWKRQRTFKFHRSRGFRHRLVNCKLCNGVSESNYSSLVLAIGRATIVLFPARARGFSLFHDVPNWLGGPLTSYAMNAGGYFVGNKVSGAWSWPLTSIVIKHKDNPALTWRSIDGSIWKTGCKFLVHCPRNSC
jgi:hypothetical protein